MKNIVTTTLAKKSLDRILANAKREELSAIPTVFSVGDSLYQIMLDLNAAYKWLKVQPVENKDAALFVEIQFTLIPEIKINFKDYATLSKGIAAIIISRIRDDIVKAYPEFEGKLLIQKVSLDSTYISNFIFMLYVDKNNDVNPEMREQRAKKISFKALNTTLKKLSTLTGWLKSYWNTEYTDMDIDTNRVGLITTLNGKDSLKLPINMDLDKKDTTGETLFTRLKNKCQPKNGAKVILKKANKNTILVS